jgi:hypothetical protein
MSTPWQLLIWLAISGVAVGIWQRQMLARQRQLEQSILDKLRQSAKAAGRDSQPN